MRVIFDEEKNQIDEPMAIALGSFDGIHKGHKRLLYTLKRISNDKKIKSMVFTFYKHPMAIIDPATPMTLLMDNKQKIKMFSELNIDYVKLKFFNKDFAAMDGLEFIKYLKARYDIKYIVVGYNFTFGHKGKGDVNLLRQLGKRFGYKVKVMCPYMEDGLVVSSTLIRDFIKDGFINKANNYLGHIYTIKGKVVQGDGRGRKLGFPTANVSLSSNYTLPQRGVYITRVRLGKHGFLPSVTNIGNKPTFNGKDTTIETHILDFDCNIYYSNITIQFIEKLRDERRFDSKEELIKQIGDDIKFSRRYFTVRGDFK
ncbi:MAG TPA: bifunctional riboflavin kinase/FAD synthetase [Clostridiales bacterium]|nr:bifunctional riboflavin kinase/FAD synthetase [Clostridiales bacterium]